jgi:hypothetical protein
MGLASDVSSAVLGNALSSVEMSERSEEARSFSSPEATPDGQVRERQRPQAAPVFEAPQGGWD